MSDLITRKKYTPIDDIIDIDDYADTPANWIQPGFVAEGAVTLLVGAAGNGKTNFALKVCDASARGLKLLGHQHQMRKVLYLDKDMNPVSSLKARQKWLKVNLGGNLKYCGLNDPNDVPLPDAPHILEWVGRQALPPIIVIDSLIRFLGPGRDENSSSDIAWFWSLVVKLKKLNCPIIILHHTGKNKNIRGSSDIEAGSDIMFIVRKTGGSHNTLTQIELESIPRRYRYEGLAEKTVIDISASGHFSTDTLPETDESLDAAMRDLLRANPGIAAGHFHAKVAGLPGLNKSLAVKFLKTGMSGGWISESAGAKPNSKAYTLIEGVSPAVEEVPDEATVEVLAEREDIKTRTAGVKRNFERIYAPWEDDDDDDEIQVYTQADVDDWDTEDLALQG